MTAPKILLVVRSEYGWEWLRVDGWHGNHNPAALRAALAAAGQVLDIPEDAPHGWHGVPEDIPVVRLPESWHNVYPGYVSGGYSSAEDADRAANEYRIARVHLIPTGNPDEPYRVETVLT